MVSAVEPDLRWDCVPVFPCILIQNADIEWKWRYCRYRTVKEFRLLFELCLRQAMKCDVQLPYKFKDNLRKKFDLRWCQVASCVSCWCWKTLIIFRRADWNFWMTTQKVYRGDRTHVGHRSMLDIKKKNTKNSFKNLALQYVFEIHAMHDCTNFHVFPDKNAGVNALIKKGEIKFQIFCTSKYPLWPTG